MANKRKQTVSEGHLERVEEDTSTHHPDEYIEEEERPTEAPVVTLALLMPMITALQDGQRELTKALASLAQNTQPRVATPTNASPHINVPRDGEVGSGSGATLAEEGPGRRAYKKSLVTKIYSAPSPQVEDLTDTRIAKVASQHVFEESAEEVFKQRGKSALREDDSYLTQVEMSKVCRLHLENLGIQTYMRLLRTASETAQSVEKGTREKDERGDGRASQVEAFGSGQKAKVTDNERGGGKEGRPSLPPAFRCSIAQVHLVLDKWIKDKVIQLPPVNKEPSTEDMASPLYCRYHRHLRHPTKECWNLRRMFDEKYQMGELTLQEEEGGVSQHPLFGHEEGTSIAHALLSEDNSRRQTEFPQRLNSKDVETYLQSMSFPLDGPRKRNMTPERNTRRSISGEIARYKQTLNAPYEARPPYTSGYNLTSIPQEKEREGNTSQHADRFVKTREVYPLREGLRNNKRGPPAMTYDVIHKRTKVEGDKKKEEVEMPPPFPCSMAQVHLLLDKWIKSKVVRLPKVNMEPTDKDKMDPRYCRYHGYISHPLSNCWTLRKIFYNKYKSGELIQQE